MYKPWSLSGRGLDEEQNLQRERVEGYLRGRYEALEQGQVVSICYPEIATELGLETTAVRPLLIRTVGTRTDGIHIRKS